SATNGLDNKPHTIYMSPQGKVLTQEKARQLAGYNHLVILCGHYEGVDERVLEEIVDEEISIGDYVLTGGELPACVLIDCVSRMVDGVLRCDESFEGESLYNGLLEYPQYSRPEVWNERKVPEVLLSGHHKKIEEWRAEMSLKRTREKRPDLLKNK
ncbi:MAG: tRNA (guanosine(37)-N1)-methyltransferase TrmD, partial [Clostridia bacterium]|nr:tRNA (guanosine(37)-N1)-methyltransferase TrmD [Clostridia bacterium]